MSNDLKEIVRLIGFHKQMTVKQIAESIGYSRVHLQKELGKGDNPHLKRLLIEKYGDLILDVSRETQSINNKNPGEPGQASEVVLLREIIKLKDQIIAMQSKENSSLQQQLDVAIKRIEGIDAKVNNCNQLIQESNLLSVEANRLSKEGNEFLKQLEGLAELAKSERLQEAADLRAPYEKKKDGKGSQAKSR